MSNIPGAVIPLLADGISPDGLNTPIVVNGEGGIPQGEEQQDLDRSLPRAGVEFALGLNPRSLLKSAKTVGRNLKNFGYNVIRIGDSAVEAGESLIKTIFRKTNFNEVPVIGTFDDTLEALSQIRNTIDDFDLPFFGGKIRKGTGGGAARDLLLQPAYSQINSNTPNSGANGVGGGNNTGSDIGTGPPTGKIPLKGTPAGDQLRYERYRNRGGQLDYDEWFSRSKGKHL